MRAYIFFIKTYWDKILLSLFVLIYIFVLSSLSINRHNAFASLYDLSNMDQTLWHTLHGHFFSLRYPEDLVSRFAVHGDLILAVLSPIYLIWDNVRILLLAQTFFLGIAAIPIYFLSMRVLKDKFTSLVISTTYLLNPGVQWTNIYDFHGVILATPFIISLVYFAHVKKWRWYWIFIFLSLITKEQISLLIAVIGVFVFVIFKKRKFGALTILLGVCWFIVMVYYIMPHFTPDKMHWALKDYGDSNIFSIAKNTLKPSIFFNTFFEKSSLDYYGLLLKPFLLIPLIGFPWILISLPALVINVLRDTRTIHFHYESSTIPGLILATIYGFGHIQILLKTFSIKKIVVKRIIQGIAIIMLISGLRMNYLYSPLPTTPSCWCHLYNPSSEDREFENLLQSLPKDASVTASVEIKSHITHRNYAYGIPSATTSADYIAFIDENRIYGNSEPKDIENKLIPQFLSSSQYETVFKGEHLFLFKNLKPDRNNLPGK